MGTPLVKQIAELLADDARKHDAEKAQLRAEIATLKVKVRKLTRQRDEAQGSAREYRSYALKYQKELAKRV